MKTNHTFDGFMQLFQGGAEQSEEPGVAGLWMTLCLLACMHTHTTHTPHTHAPHTHTQTHTQCTTPQTHTKHVCTHTHTHTQTHAPHTHHTCARAHTHTHHCNMHKLAQGLILSFTVNTLFIQKYPAVLLGIITTLIHLHRICNCMSRLIIILVIAVTSTIYHCNKRNRNIHHCNDSEQNHLLL